MDIWACHPYDLGTIYGPKNRILERELSVPYRILEKLSILPSLGKYLTICHLAVVGRYLHAFGSL